jgi:hypothetical protein
VPCDEGSGKLELCRQVDGRLKHANYDEFRYL